MNRRPGFPIPPIVLALDVLGVLLVGLGAVVLTGNDFGHPVLVKVAPGLIALGVLLIVPMVVWVVRQAKSQAADRR